MPTTGSHPFGRLPDPADADRVTEFLDRAVAWRVDPPHQPPDRGAARAPVTVDLLLSCVDLTRLDADVTDAALVSLCHQASRPDPHDSACPPVAAVCSWSDSAATLRRALDGTGVAACVVAGGFPNGRQPASVVAADVAAARAAGADEIDVPLHRGLLVSGRDADTLAHLRGAVGAAGDTPVKAILETGALSSAATRRAAWIAVLAGARWLKTSTGQLAGGATVEAVDVLADVAAAAHAATGREVGVKASGGLRTVEHATAMATTVATHLGPVDASRVRLGASGLLDVLVEQRNRPR